METGRSIVGTWRLVGHEPTGEGDDRWGPNPSGYLIYTSGGHMSVAMMAAARPRFASGNRLRGTPEEYAAAASRYISYSGRYELQGDHVVHRIEVCLFPNWIGTALTRKVELSGDQLRLTTVGEGSGRGSVTVIWERA